jgi:small subunit ribosomal protein S16
MIRLARVGARKQPYYRIVVIEKDRARNGRSVEVIGTYNPRTTPASVDLKQDRVTYWTGNGAQLSDRVAKLVKDYKPPVDGEPAPDKKTRRPEPKKPVAAAEPEAAAETVAAEPAAEPAIAEPAAPVTEEPAAAA